MSRRAYDGPPVDATVQHLAEAPYRQGDGETVAVVDDDPTGEATVENVPTPPPAGERPDVTGQTTFDDWGWSR